MPVRLAVLVLAAALAAAAAFSPGARAQDAPLAELEFDIVGVRLVADPPALTVPKGIATQVAVRLDVPAGAADTADALAALAGSGATVTAELRGPELTPRTIAVRPGEPIPLPPFALPGDYFLDRIRLERDGAAILAADPSTVPIRVISEVFITSVTSRPLSLEEIRAKGIVIDESSFTAVSFQLALNFEGREFRIELPVALPSPEMLRFQPEPQKIIESLALVNQALAEAAPVQLPPEFDRPGLNFSIAALPFFPASGGDGDGLPFGAPPITGLVVIPGNVGFLNQFFSVLLMVTNVAPDGTPLVLRDVTGTISLPTGLDRTPGTPDVPGDDPLRLARIEGIGAVPVVPVVQSGPDRKLGTADDVARIPPGASGEGEFLLEGRLEGSHTVDIEIRATLDGLDRPIPLMGKALGSVFVRNPTFSITIAHPRTVAAGESYDVFATITNTSRTPANLASVSLPSRSISGAVLHPDTEPTVVFETIPPNDSRTARFTLIATVTGECTAAALNLDPGLAGKFELRTGVGERGIPLAPNAIVLPKTTEVLPPSLVFACQRVLGQALSIAQAPAGSLPPEVLYVKRQTVLDRGVEVAEAGQRVILGDSLEAAARDLLFDWLGGARMPPDPGFDQLLRQTDAGATFRAEIARVLGPALAAAPGGALGYQETLARAFAPRDPHIQAIAAATGGPVTLRIVDGASGAEPAYGGALRLREDVGAATDLALLTRAVPGRYAIEVQAIDAAATVDLGIVVAGAATGQLVQVRYAAVALGAGETARVLVDVPDPGTGTSPTVTASLTETGRADVAEAPPQLVNVRQLESSFYGYVPLGDPARAGVLVAALFDKPVAAASAESPARYAVERNAVAEARIQPSGRVVYLYLEKPVGIYVERTITVDAVADLRGNVLAPAVTRPIQTVVSDGARVFGQVVEADGRPVPNALLDLTVVISSQIAIDVARIFTGPDGEFDFDFVLRSAYGFKLTAQHPRTLKLVTLNAYVRAPGAQMLLNPTFRGTGTARGVVRSPDGTPVRGAVVFLLPNGMTASPLAANANDLGEYAIEDVPVGPYIVRSFDSSGAFGEAAGLIPTAGAEDTTDILLVLRVADAGRLAGRVFLADGQTPAEGYSVYVGGYDRNDSTIAAVGVTTTDAAGSFAFERLRPGRYDVVAVDPGRQEIGVASAVQVVTATTAFARIVLEATGDVSGIVLDAQGNPVPGALIAGGLTLGTADAAGQFQIVGVPAGRRTIEAGDPVTKRRGRADVTVLSGQTVPIVMRLEARATIEGRVLDANGVPVPRATVRIPQSDGFIFVFANDDGRYRFPDLPLGDYLIQAPGPDQRSMIEAMEKLGLDPRSAFTAIPPDLPPELAAPEPEPSPDDPDAVLAAYKRAVETLFSLDDPRLQGAPPAPAGGFGWTRVRLRQDSETVVRNIRYLEQGTVSGTTIDGGSGLPLAANVQVRGLTVSGTGAPGFGELARVRTDPLTGAFTFGGIARFDLTTFQTTGIRGGDFSLLAAASFSPAQPSFRGQLNPNAPNATGIDLVFPPLADTNGTVSGIVYLPDGLTPAPDQTEVTIGFGTPPLTVRTDAQGRFQTLFPIPPSAYSVTAFEPQTGLRGQIYAAIPPGGNVDVEVRLLGLGTVDVTVRRPNGAPVPDANVVLERGGFPGDRATGTTGGPNGTISFGAITEGPFGVMVEEQGTGLKGRASGVVVRDAAVSVVVTIQGSGTVTGAYVAVADGRPISNAQVVLVSGGLQAYATTDAAGRFEVRAVPVGRFTVEAVDPRTGRLGRAGGEVRFEGQVVDVTVVEHPRGTVEGFVFNADGHQAIPGASIEIQSTSAASIRLAATTRPDGSFSFEGISAGPFVLFARDLVTDFRGQVQGRVAAEGEVVRQDVLLDGIGSIRVTVIDANGDPVGNAEVSLAARGLGRPPAPVDPTGVVTFDRVRFAEYEAIARSLANSRDGGVATVTVDEPNELAEVTVQLGGTGDIEVTVQDFGGAMVAGALVTLQSRSRFIGATPIAFSDQDGVARFEGIPLGELFVEAERAALAGVATGAIATPGETVALTVMLQPSGSIVGRAFLPGGQILAADAIVTLEFFSQSSLQTGVLQVRTDLMGTFAFSGIPLGDFTVSILEPISAGVERRQAALTQDGETFDLGDLVLDHTAPRIVAIAPADGATGVAGTAPVVLTFSEEMQAGSFVQSDPGRNVILTQGTARVPGQLVVAADGLGLTFTPTAPLLSGRLYTFTVLGVPQGPRDRVGLGLIDPFVATFTVADSVPPEVLLPTSPAGGATGIGREAVVRVAFSEAVADGVAIAVVDGAGNPPVAGRVDLILGSSVAVFTPTGFLSANATYTVTVGNVFDQAGNPLSGSGSYSFAFSTVDTMPPAIADVTLVGSPLAGSTVRLVPTLAGGGADVDRVEYALSDGTARIGRAAPLFAFAAEIALPAGAGGGSIGVTAVAVDRAGNRSDPFPTAIAIVEDVLPTVAIATPAGLASVAAGETVTLDVSAEDDFGLFEVRVSAVLSTGGTSASATIPVAVGVTEIDTTVDLTIPADAPSTGNVTFQAVAIDRTGRPGPSFALPPVPLRDGRAPAVAIASPVAGAVVLPGASVQVVVTASDEAGLATVVLDATPAVPGTGTRTIAAGVRATTETFTLQVPTNLTAPATIDLVARATDASGNPSAQAPRTLVIADTGGGGGGPAAGIVTGTIFEATPSGGAGAPVVGAQVTINRALTGGQPGTIATDAQGRYRFEGVPLGGFTLDATTAGGDRGRATNQVSQDGETRTVDIVLNGLGAAVVTVLDAADAPIGGATVTLTGQGPFGGSQVQTTTAAAGQATFATVLAGPFSASAVDPASGLSGTASGTVPVGGQAGATIRLAATGSIQGVVLDPAGAPVDGARVRLLTTFFGLLGETTTAGGGAFRFDGRAAGTYVLEARDVQNRLRARETGVVLATNGGTAVRDLAFIGLGTVTGTARTGAGAPVQAAQVTVRSAHPLIGGTLGATTNASGGYLVEGVPVGTFSVVASVPAQQLLGEAAGLVATDGDIVTADLTLLSNGIGLPRTLNDASGFAFDVQGNGSVREGTSLVYRGDTGTNRGAFLLDIVPAGGGAPVRFTAGTTGTEEDGGRELAIRQTGLAGLDVTRKVFAPREGYFVRYVETLSNPSPTEALTVSVRVTSHLRSFSGVPTIIATSSGDAVLDVAAADPAGADRYVVLDDGADADPFLVSGIPAVAFVFDGAGAATRVASATYERTAFGRLVWQWDAVTLAPGATVAFAYFGVQQTSRAAALASAERLAALPPEALAGLGAAELALVSNFALPADGVSPLAPLPALDGEVTGVLLASDGATPVRSASVRFRSAHPLFGRTHSTFSGATDGSFRFRGSFASASTPLAVPVADFTLEATHPTIQTTTATQPGSFAGTFAGNLSLVRATATASTSFPGFPPSRAIDDSLDTSWFTAVGDAANLGTTPFIDVTLAADATVTAVNIRGNRSFANGFDFFRGRIELFGASGGAALHSVEVDLPGPTRDLDVDVPDTVGVRRVRFTSLADESNEPGLSEIQVLGSIPASAGFARVDVVFTGTAIVRGVVRRHTGDVATGSGTVSISRVTPPVNGQVSLGAGAVYEITGVPPGTFGLAASVSHPQGSALRGTAAVTVAGGQTAVQDVVLEATGALTGTVTTAAGAAAGGVTVQVRNASFTFARSTTTSAAGVFTLDDIPAGGYTLEAFEPLTFVPAAAQVTVVADQTTTQDLVLTGLGTVQALVTFANGTPVPGRTVFIQETARGTLRSGGSTDSTGRVTIQNVTVGAFTLQVTHPNAFNLVATATGAIATNGETVPATVRLPALAAVALAVTRAGGQAPFEGAFVQLSGAFGHFDSGSTAADGTLVLAGVPEGPFTVDIYEPSRFVLVRTASGAVASTDEGATIAVPVVMPAVATVRVTVEGAGGTPFAGAFVFIRDPFDPFDRFLGQTGQDGRVDAPSVLEGPFGVYARSPSSFAFIGSAAGSVGAADDLGTVAVTIATPVAGTVEGTVFAADGLSPVAQARVALLDAASGQEVGSLFTTATGAYEFDGVAVGSAGFRVRAESPTDSAITAERTGAFPTAGATVQLDITLPISVVRGTVSFPDGARAAFPLVSGTPGSGGGSGFFLGSSTADGRYTVVGLPVGAFTVTAQDDESGLRATGGGTIADPSTPVVVDIVLPPSGTVSGLVLDAGGNPVAFAQVDLQTEGVPGFTRFGVTDGLGRYEFRRVGLGSVAAESCRPAATQPQLCGAAYGVLATAGATIQVDVPIDAPAPGTVTGTVRGPGGASLGEGTIIVENFAAVTFPFQAFRRFATTAPDGTFSVAGVPTGRVRVTALSPSESGPPLGVVEVTLPANGSVVADVTLGTATAFPAILDGADGFRHDVGCDGSLGFSGASDGRFPSFGESGGLGLRLGGAPFSCRDAGVPEDAGRELAVGAVVRNHLLVTRKVFVPALGGFARYLEIVENPTTVPWSLSLEVESELASGADTRVVVAPGATNGGYAVTDDGLTRTPVGATLAHVFAGPGGALTPAATRFADTDRRVSFRYDLTVPPGETRIVLHFVAQRDAGESAAAQVQADALSGLTDPDALAGLSAAERAAVVNFDVP